MSQDIKKKSQTVELNTLFCVPFEMCEGKQKWQNQHIVQTKFKDTHRENTASNRTEALTKNMNMYIWAIGTLNQLFIRGSHTQIKFLKK